MPVQIIIDMTTDTSEKIVDLDKFNKKLLALMFLIHILTNNSKIKTFSIIITFLTTGICTIVPFNLV